MNISYQLSLNEYQEAAHVHYKNGKRPLFVAIYVGLATFIILSGTDFENTREVINNILVTFFAISFYLLFTRMITAYQAKRVYTNHPLLAKEVCLHVSGKGIHPDKNSELELLPWEIFMKYKKSEKYYLLYTSAHQFNVLPRRAMNKAQEEALDTYLGKYIHS